MSAIQDLGICIRQWDWSETSQVVCVLGRETGLVRAVAKGSRRPKARYSGGLEVPSAGEFQARLKQGEGLSLLTSWDLSETFPRARTSLSAFHTALALVDVAFHSLEHADPHPAVFDELLATLRAVGESDRTDRIALLWFLWCVLSETGHRPELTIDVRTGGALGPESDWAFAPQLGGFVSSAIPDAGTGPLWRTRATTARLLRTLPSEFGKQGLSVFVAGAPSDRVETERRAARLLAQYFVEVFHCEPDALVTCLERWGS